MSSCHLRQALRLTCDHEGVHQLRHRAPYPHCKLLLSSLLLRDQTPSFQIGCEVKVDCRVDLGAGICRSWIPPPGLASNTSVKYPGESGHRGFSLFPFLLISDFEHLDDASPSTSCPTTNFEIPQLPTLTQLTQLTSPPSPNTHHPSLPILPHHITCCQKNSENLISPIPNLQKESISLQSSSSPPQCLPSTCSPT